MIGNIYTKDEIEDAEFETIPERKPIDDTPPEERYKTMSLNEPQKEEKTEGWEVQADDLETPPKEVV